MKLKARIKNVLAAALAVAVIVGFTPQMEAPAYADATGVDFSGYVNTTTVFNFNGVEWYIIGDSTKGVRPENGTVTLLTKNCPGDTHYGRPKEALVYYGSILRRSAYNFYYDNFKETNWTIKPVDLTDVGTTGEMLWPLSLDEARSLPTDLLLCENSDSWLLRTATESDVWFVQDFGEGNVEIKSDERFIDKRGLRLALKLDLRYVDFDNETKTFTPIADPPIYNVYVKNGTGEGSYKAGTKVTVNANANAAGKEFNRWKGADGLICSLSDSHSSRMSFYMPAHDVNLEATYTAVSDHKHNDIEFVKWTDELAAEQYGDSDKKANNSLPKEEGDYYLDKHVDLGSSSWDVPAGTTNLCLNGYDITSKDDDGTIVLYNRDSTLNIYDEHTGDSDGVISSEDEDGVLLYEKYTAFNMYGGKISGCDDYGVDLYNTGTEFNMYGGEISNCDDGVDIDSGATFTLHNGNIKGNSHCGVDSYGTTIIENGSITNNKTGINTSPSTKAIILQGSNISPVITGNTEHNLLLNRSDDLKIKVNDGTTINGNAQIGVYPTKGTTPETGVFTDGLSGKIQGDKTAADIFKSDDNGYFVSAAENGEAQLEKSEQPVVDPVGNIDAVTGKEGSIDVAGWAFDPSDMTQPIDVHVYIGGEADATEAEGHAITANLERSDVDQAYHCGKNHGFSSTITTDKRGEQPVYIYAINIGEGNNVLLGSTTVTISEIQYPLNIVPGEGSGDVISTKVTKDESFEFPECNFKEPEGKAFDHWGMTGVDGVFNPGSIVKIAENCVADGVITVTAYWKETTHVHDWSYTASGATITATCNNQGCYIKNGLTMTITGPDPETLIYDGEKKAASLNTDYNATAFPGNYEILYTGTGDTTYNSKEAPSEPGSYKASVTVGEGEKAVTAETEFVISEKPEPKPEPKAVKMAPKAMTAKGKKALTIRWSKAADAEGYDIFFAKCGKAKCKKIKTINGNKTFSWTKKKLKAKTAYKTYVKAWVKIDGEKKYFGTDPTVCAYTSNGTKMYTNAKSVTVNKAKVSMKAGKTFKIKAKVNKVSKKKKLMPAKYAAKLRYMSSDSKIATVSKTGKIKARAEGTCKVYVFAHNGVKRTVSVTVK